MLSDISSSCVTWLHLGAPFLIRQTQLSGGDFHPRVSSEPLIEDEETNRMVMPKFRLFIPLFFNVKSIHGCFK